MLKSFVSEKDYSVLLDILIKIKENRLNKNVSIIVLHGNGRTGKSTLTEIMFVISGSVLHQPFINMDRGYPTNPLDLYNSLYSFRESESKFIDDISFVNSLLQKLPRKSPNQKPGVGICTTYNKIVIKEYENNHKRKVVYLHLPNEFTNDVDRDFIVETCVYEFDEEYKAYLKKNKEMVMNNIYYYVDQTRILQSHYNKRKIVSSFIDDGMKFTNNNDMEGINDTWKKFKDWYAENYSGECPIARYEFKGYLPKDIFHDNKEENP